MKKTLLLFALLLIPCLAAAQGFRIGESSSISSSLNAGGVIFTIANPTVNICNHPANAVPCTNKVTTYTSISLAVTCPTSQQLVLAGTTTCVTQGDRFGNWGAWVPAGTYDWTVTLPTGQSLGPYVITTGGLGGGGGPGGSSIQAQFNNGGAFGGSSCVSLTSLATGPLNFGCNASQVNHGNIDLNINSGGGSNSITATLGSIRYVATNGNDSNDGLSWGTAKLTITAAICALPYGNCGSSPRVAGAGTVIYQEGVSADVTNNVGIWIAGAGDSQYASLPAGWMKADASGGLDVHCGTRATPVAHEHQPGCAVGTFTVGTNKPTVWLSGTVNPMYFADFATANGTPVAWISVDSTGCISGSGVGACTAPGTGQSISVTLENVSGGPTAGEVGQDASLIVGNGYWLHVRDSSFNGNLAYQNLLTSAARTSNVVTYTVTSGFCHFNTGQQVSIMLMADPTFNGTKTVATGCGGGATFTVNQTGPNASTGSNGGTAAAFGDAGFAVILSSSQIVMKNLHFEASGGLKAYNVGGNCSLLLDDAYMEGLGGPTTPLVWTQCGARISNLTASDTVPAPGIINDNGSFLTAIGVGGVNEPGILGPGKSIDSYSQFTSTSSLLAQGGSGWANNQYFQAQMDTARRTGSPTAVRFPSGIAATSAWYNVASGAIGSGFTLSSVADPYGGTGATQIASGGGIVPVSMTTAGLYSGTLAVGDDIIMGTWIRFPTTIPPSPAILFTLSNLGFGNGDLCTSGGGTSAIYPYYGDGNWFWLTARCTVWTLPSNTPQTVFYVNAPASPAVVQVFNPVIMRIPSGTLSNNEIEDLRNTLNGYSTSPVAGDVAFSPAERFCLPSATASNGFCDYQVHADTVNRTKTWPDVTGTPLVSSIGTPGTTGHVLAGVPVGTFTAYDPFNRASLNTSGPCSSGSCWTAIPTLSLPTITANQIVGSTPVVFTGAYWNANTFLADQFSEINTPNGGSSANGAVETTCRQSAGAYTLYRFYFYNGNFIIGETLAGVASNLTTAAGTLNAGDELTFTCMGSTLTGYQNGTQVLQTTNTDITAGQPGFLMYGNIAQSTGDNWTAGNLGAPLQPNIETDTKGPLHIITSLTVGNSAPIAGALPAGSITASSNIVALATACTNGELALSSGWQSTGSATVTAVAGTGQTCSWTITTGTTTAANPTVTDTLTNALISGSVVCEMNIHGGTHTAAAGEGFQQTSLSATAPVFTFNGTPTAGGTTYFVTRRCGP
jgi:hypothetical protein